MKNILVTILLIASAFFGLSITVSASSIQDDAPIDNGIKGTPYYLPLVSGWNAPQDPQRFVDHGFPFNEYDRELWCNGSPGFICKPVEGLENFTYEAPQGYTISFLRLFSYYWFPPNGGHVLFLSAGCFGNICVYDVDGKIESKTATKVQIKVWYDPSLFDTDIMLADVCLERAGSDYKVVCDNNYYTKFNLKNLFYVGK